MPSKCTARWARHKGEAKALISFEEGSTTDVVAPMAKAMEYVERAEYMYIAPGQATVSAC
ncbi:MAG: hypothetical protein ACREDF_11260 [Thermoplasmata archaeon]